MEDSIIDKNIKDETLEQLEVLAQLSLTDEEKKQAAKDLKQVLSYVDKLNELDTSEIGPMKSVFQKNNVMREDIVTNGNAKDLLLANAPALKDGLFVVPKTIG